MIQAKPVQMSSKLSVCSCVMFECFYAMIRAVDGIIDSRLYVFYPISYFYATIVKIL